MKGWCLDTVHLRTNTNLARVAPISDSVIGGMLTSKCAITQANRTYILNDSLSAFFLPVQIYPHWLVRVGNCRIG